jgi:hypothetical protein
MAVEDPDLDLPRSRQAIPKTRKPLLLPYVFFPRELPPRTNGEAMRRQIMLEIFLGGAAVVAADYFAPNITSIAPFTIASNSLRGTWARAPISVEAGPKSIARSRHRRNYLGKPVVGRGNSNFDARIEMAVAVFPGLVQDGGRQRGPAAEFRESRSDLIFVAG